MHKKRLNYTYNQKDDSETSICEGTHKNIMQQSSQRCCFSFSFFVLEEKMVLTYFQVMESC